MTQKYHENDKIVQKLNAGAVDIPLPQLLEYLQSGIEIYPG